MPRLNTKTARVIGKMTQAAPPEARPPPYHYGHAATYGRLIQQATEPALKQIRGYSFGRSPDANPDAAIQQAVIRRVKVEGRRGRPGDGREPGQAGSYVSSPSVKAAARAPAQEAARRGQARLSIFEVTRALLREHAWRR